MNGFSHWSGSDKNPRMLKNRPQPWKWICRRSCSDYMLGGRLRRDYSREGIRQRLVQPLFLVYLPNVGSYRTGIDIFFFFWHGLYILLNRTFDPLIFGDYPPEMRHYHGNELPSFSPEEKDIIKGSIDFIGLNHYSTFYVKDCIYSSCALGGDRPIRGFSNTTGYRDGVPIGDRVWKFCIIIQH